MIPRMPPRRPILEALPPELRSGASPDPAARKAWCHAYGCSVLELMRAERPRPLPSKKKSVRDDQETP